MSAISKRIQQAALGPTPKAHIRNARAWVGSGDSGRVLDFKGTVVAGEKFYAAPDDVQRTFLLLVAEALA